MNPETIAAIARLVANICEELARARQVERDELTAVDREMLRSLRVSWPDRAAGEVRK